MGAEVSQRIKILLQMLGMGDVALPDEPVVSLSIDDQLTVNIGMTDNTQVITFFCSVGKLVEGDFQQAKQLLSGNLFSAQYPSAMTAIDEVTNEVILWTQLDLGLLDDAGVFQAFEAYINQVEEHIQGASPDRHEQQPSQQNQGAIIGNTFGVKV